MSDRFVAADADGRQHHEGYVRSWPLPVRKGDEWEPGGVVAPDEHGAPVTFDVSQLLEELGECIFVAELVDDAGAARLVRGTAWSETVAAMFALDSVEHILGAVPGSADAELPGGGTLGAIIASTREYLTQGTGADGHKLGRIARMAATRRMRRESTTLSDAAFSAAAQDEGRDIDVDGRSRLGHARGGSRCRAGSGRGCAARRLPVPGRPRDATLRGARGGGGDQGRRGGHALGPVPRRRRAEVRAVVGCGP